MVNHLEIGGSHVVMVNSVFDVFHIIVSYRHADFTKFVDHFLLWILPPISDSFVSAIQLFSEGLLSFFAVDLGQLLHF